MTVSVQASDHLPNIKTNKNNTHFLDVYYEPGIMPDIWLTLAYFTFTCVVHLWVFTFLYCKGGNWGSERRNILTKITQLPTSEVNIRTYILLIPPHCPALPPSSSPEQSSSHLGLDPLGSWCGRVCWGNLTLMTQVLLAAYSSRLIPMGGYGRESSKSHDFGLLYSLRLLFSMLQIGAALPAKSLVLVSLRTEHSALLFLNRLVFLTSQFPLRSPHARERLSLKL